MTKGWTCPEAGCADPLLHWHVRAAALAADAPAGAALAAAVEPPAAAAGALSRRDYELAIERLQLAMGQLQPDGELCAVCGSDDHQAFECRFNPLRAVRLCVEIAKEAHELHEQLHEYSAARSTDGAETLADFADDVLHDFLHYLYQDVDVTFPIDTAAAPPPTQGELDEH